jgi:hypothetical protein
MTLDDLIEQARGKGPERHYLDWLKTQPSVLSGQFSWNDGSPFCEPAHWRTARHCGVGQKPAFLAIPLTHQEHAQQHRKGQSVIGSREWWQKQCEAHLRRWISL